MVALAKRLQQSIILFLLLLGSGGCGTPIEFNLDLDLASPPLAALATDTNATILDKLHQASAALIAEADAVGERCKQTHGLWRPLLHSCRCPAHTVFLVEEGCIPPPKKEFAELLKLQQAMDAARNGNTTDNLDVYFSDHNTFTYFKADYFLSELELKGFNHLNDLSKIVNFDSTRLIADISFARGLKNIVFQSSTILDDSDHAIADTALDGHPISASVMESLDAFFEVDVRNYCLSDNNTPPSRQACAKNLAAALMPRKEERIIKILGSRIDDFCVNLLKAVDFVVHPDQSEAKVLPSLMRSFEPHCSVNCTKNIEFIINNLRFSYDLSMVGFVGMQRRIILNLADSGYVAVRLSPSGQILRIDFFLTEANPAKMAFSFYESELQLNGNFTLFNQSNTLIGNIFQLRDKLAARSNDWLLPSDSLTHLTEIPIGAAIVDGYFHLSKPEFIRRLALTKHLPPANTLELFHSFNDYAINQIPIDVQNSQNHLMAPILFNHGHQTASIVMNDLVNIHLKPISFLEIESKQNSDKPIESATLLCKQFKANQIKVVALPFVRDPFLGQCAEFFTTLAQQCPEVLFVTSAGNMDTELFGASCPSGLDPYLDNFITVAGVQTNLHRLEQSVHSKHLISIAAPIEIRTLEPDFSVRKSAGTSYAAPAIANAALHLLARRPYLSPKQVIQLLKKHCFHDGLPLICGGALNFEAFFKQEVENQS